MQAMFLMQESWLQAAVHSMLFDLFHINHYLDDVTILLGQIVQEARALTEAERCSVFLVNKESDELVAKVFDGIVTVDEVRGQFLLVFWAPLFMHYGMTVVVLWEFFLSQLLKCHD